MIIFEQIPVVPLIMGQSVTGDIEILHLPCFTVEVAELIE